MTEKIYIVKKINPWMINELIAFSRYTKYKLILLRKPGNFYIRELSRLAENGIEIFLDPFCYKIIIKKLLFVILFFLKNIAKFKLNYNGIIGSKSLWWFLRIDLSKISPTVSIHSQFATQATIIALMIKQYFNNTPVYSFTFHAHDIYFKNVWISTLISQSYRSFSISDYNIDYVRTKYISSDKIVLSRLGVFKSTEKERLCWKEAYLTIGFMSWFVEKKGIQYLLNAFVKMKKLGINNCHLILAGDGPLKESITSFIEFNNLENRINYIGKLNNDEKEKFFKSIDVFILPAISFKNDKDGIPVVLMEAIDYGLPLISTCTSGIPEICIDNYNGILIKERSEEEIISAIIKYLNMDIEKYVTLSKNSLIVSKKYDLIKNSNEKLKLMKWM